jgi:hypothetical protein
LAGEGEKFFEVRGKGGEVRVFAGFDPRGAREADGELVFFDKFGGDTSGTVVVVTPTGDGGGLGGVGWEGSAFALIEPAGDVGVGREAVGDASEKGGLFGAEGVAFRGEEGFLIPAEEASGSAEKGEVFAASAEFFVGIRERGHGAMMKQQKVRWNVFLVRREILSKLPKSFDGGIFTKLGVSGEEGQFFSQTLGDENAVERVAVMKGKVNRATDMGPRDGKWFCDFLIDPLFSKAL